MTPPDSGEREVLTPIPPAEHFATVAISLDLAQRILAALEDEARSGNVSAQRLQALAAELRERLPR